MPGPGYIGQFSHPYASPESLAAFREMVHRHRIEAQQANTQERAQQAGAEYQSGMLGLEKKKFAAQQSPWAGISFYDQMGGLTFGR